jgi:exonuclease III
VIGAWHVHDHQEGRPLIGKHIEMCSNISETNISNELNQMPRTNRKLQTYETPPCTPPKMKTTPPTTPEPTPQVRGPGGMGIEGWRVGTLNFCGFKRATGGMEMGCAQVRRVMEDSKLDVMIVTEHKMGGRGDLGQVAKLLRKNELGCQIAGGTTSNESHGTGVMLVWRDEKDGDRKLSNNKQYKSDDGRVVTVEFTNPAAKKKTPVLIIGVYGVSGNKRLEEASNVWITVGRCIRNFHKRHPDGGVIMAGDFNAHANKQDGPRTNLIVDNTFAAMLTMNNFVDTAKEAGEIDLGPTHKPRNGGTKEGEVSGNRLDRVYVSGINMVAAIRAVGVGAVPEDKVIETDHGVVWCDLHTGAWEAPTPQPVFPGKPRVASQGVGEFTHPRSKGVPTRLSNNIGVAATVDQTVEWMELAGYDANDLVETPALNDGNVWMSAWMKGGRRKGGLATPTWKPEPGETGVLESVASRIGGPKQSGEHWIKWKTESWAKHAVSRGNGWPQWGDAPVTLGIGLDQGRHSHCDCGWLLEFQAEISPTRKQVNKYLHDTGIPGNVSITCPGDHGGGRSRETKQGGDTSNRWRIESAKDDTECKRWVRDFGTSVADKLEWKSSFATGWCRYKIEAHSILSARSAEVVSTEKGDATALITCLLKTCNEAGKRAFGMCGGGQRGGWNKGLIPRLTETSADVLAGLDTLLSVQSNVDEKWILGWVPWAKKYGIEQLVLDYCKTPGPKKAAAGHELAAMRREVGEEVKRMGRAMKRRGIQKWKTDFRTSFMNNKGKFLNKLLRETRGRGGAAPESDENGIQRNTSRKRGGNYGDNSTRVRNRVVPGTT